MLEGAAVHTALFADNSTRPAIPWSMRDSVDSLSLLD
jgi:hypothetical protein